MIMLVECISLLIPPSFYVRWEDVQRTGWVQTSVHPLSRASFKMHCALVGRSCRSPNSVTINYRCETITGGGGEAPISFRSLLPRVSFIKSPLYCFHLLKPPSAASASSPPFQRREIDASALTLIQQLYSGLLKQAIFLNLSRVFVFVLLS